MKEASFEEQVKTYLTLKLEIDKTRKDLSEKIMKCDDLYYHLTSNIKEEASIAMKIDDKVIVLKYNSIEIFDLIII